MSKINKWWSPDRKGVIQFLGDTAIYTRPTSNKHYYQGIQEAGNGSWNVYAIEDTDEGTFYKIAVNKWVKQSNSVAYSEPEQVGADGNAMSLLSMNNLVLIGGMYLMFRVLGGTLSFIRKKV